MSSTTATNTSGLSKSQKKRMKQKASKAKREAEQKNQAANASNGAGNLANNSSAALNPHEKLCNDLVRKGYSLPEIENALEEMWNLGMQYDDFSAVLAYLEAKRAQKEADAEREAAAQVAADAVENASESTPASTAASGSVENDELEENPEAEKWEEQESEEASSVPESETAPAAPSSLSGSESQSQPLDLASKLDVVAKFEILYDAVFALAEWVNKAAKPEQLTSLCTNGQSNQSPPLYTIIQRVIQSPSESEFESVLPALLSLSTGISQVSGNKSNVIAANTLSDTLKYVRDAVRLSASNQFDEINPMSFSEAIVNSVADQICQSFKLMISYGLSSCDSDDSQYEGDKETVIQKLENEIDSLLSQQPPANGGGVMELMTRRDCTKTAAEKSSMVTKLVLPGQKSDFMKMGESIESSLNEEGKIRLLSDLFDGQYHTFQRSRSAYVSLESRLDSVNASWAQERNQITTELDSCQAEITKIQLRKEELQKEMDLLNAEGNAIEQRQLQLKGRLESIYNSSSTPEIDNLKMELKRRAGLIEVEEKVTGIVDKLKSLEGYLAVGAVQAMNRNSEKSNFGPTQVQSKLEAFLILAKNYFISESECVTFMSNRVKSIQLDAKELQREIAECTALGMATNVSKMSSSLETLSRNIAEDEAVIGLLRADSETMRDDLVGRVTEYTVASNVLTPSHQTILNAIGFLLTRIGISSNFHLFNTNRVQNSVQVKPALYQEKKEDTSKTNILPPVQQEPPVVEPMAPPIKLSWAARSAPKSTAKSLVDIQKEELSRKN